MIGIIGALEEETKLICADIDNGVLREKTIFTFVRGRLEGQDVVVVKCGVGKVNAALCTQILLDEYACDFIIFCGVAGALLPGLRQGDIVVSSHAVQFDVDLTAFGRRHGETPDADRMIEADPQLVKNITDAFDDIKDSLEGSPNLIVGTIVSGDRFISDPETIKWLQREFGAACTEMEGGALGYTCHINRVPFAIIRAISDSADSEAAQHFSVFLESSSRVLHRLIKAAIVRLKPLSTQAGR